MTLGKGQLMDVARARNTVQASSVQDCAGERWAVDASIWLDEALQSVLGMRRGAEQGTVAEGCGASACGGLGCTTSREGCGTNAMCVRCLGRVDGGSRMGAT